MLVGEFPNLNDLASISSTADTEMQEPDDNEDSTTEMVMKKRWEFLSDRVKSLILKMISINP